jgi:NADH-quinone oxidoreductase subunit K
MKLFIFILNFPVKLQMLLLWEYSCTLAFTLIFIGFFGIAINQIDIVKLLLSIEIFLLGISFLFINFSLFYLDPKGQIIALLILVLAGAESALGLSILLICNRLFGAINFLEFISLKG